MRLLQFEDVLQSSVKAESIQNLHLTGKSKRRPMAMFFLFLFFMFAGQIAGESKQPSEDLGALLIHHVTDGNQWNILPAVKPIPIHNISIGSLTIPVTKHVVMLLISSAVLIIVFCAAFSGSKTIPNKIGIALEPLTLFVRDGLVYPAMGEELGSKWLPFFCTLFFFLLATNILGLIPLFGTATGNLSVAAALAIMVFIGVVGQGMLRLGFIGFFKNMIPKGLPLPIGLFIFCIEVPGLIIRNGVLAIRLFANMVAGHFVILSLLLLIFVIHPLASLVSVPLALFIDLLEVLVAIIQAMVFTLLSAIFIGMASSHH